MGKIKRNKTKRNGPQPTGLPSVKDCERLASQDNPTSEVSDAVLSLIEKLQGPSADERECTCSTIANLINQPETLRQFLGAGVVRVLAPLLVDPSVGVRRASLGALRNITVDGGPDICTKMVEEDVMTPLVALLQQFGPDWRNGTKSQFDIEVYHEALHLLWNLCEVSPVAMTIVNQQQVVPVLVPGLIPSCYGYPIAVTTAQCLYTVTEDNEEASRHLSRPDTIQELYKILGTEGDGSCDTEHLLHKVLLAGILYNVGGGHLSSLGGAVLNHVIELLLKVLQQDLLQHLQRVSEFLVRLQDPHEGSSGVADERENGTSSEAESSTIKQKINDPLERKHKQLDKLLDESQNLVTAQQLAIEITTNLCSSQDEEGWEDLEESDSGSDDFSTDISESDARGQDEAMEQTSDNGCLLMPEEIQSALVSSGIVHKVFLKLKPANQEMLDILGKHNQSKRLKRSYEALQVRALLCTSNIVSALGVEEVGGADVLQELWGMLSRSAGDAVTGDNAEMLEGTTGALRAIADKLADMDSPQLQSVTDTDLQFLYKLGTQCCHPVVRVNTTQIISILGCHFVQQNQLAHLKNIGEYLCQVVTLDSELWVTAEALDAMFDVFADDKTDPVVKELGLVGKLQTLLPTLKQKVKQQKRHLGEHYAIVSTAKTNLLRFIKYKVGRPAAT